LQLLEVLLQQFTNSDVLLIWILTARLLLLFKGVTFAPPIRQRFYEIYRKEKALRLMERLLILCRLRKILSSRSPAIIFGFEISQKLMR
jgi:hypothetical protein